MRKIKGLLSLYFVLLIAISCNTQEKLPILGEKQTIQKTINGSTVAVEVNHTIPAFEFTDQYGKAVTNADFRGQSIYVADFFFTSCPTICPKMKTQMLRLYKKYKGNKAVKFLSHSIDPRHDTVPVLNEYAQKLGVSDNQWRFVTGDKEKIYTIAAKGYMTSALEDSNAEGGFVHSGAFVLVDKKQQVRAVFDGTKPEQVDQMEEAIEALLKEGETPQ